MVIPAFFFAVSMDISPVETMERIFVAQVVPILVETALEVATIESVISVYNKPVPFLDVADAQPKNKAERLSNTNAFFTICPFLKNFIPKNTL